MTRTETLRIVTGALNKTKAEIASVETELVALKTKYALEEGYDEVLKDLGVAGARIGIALAMIAVTE